MTIREKIIGGMTVHKMASNLILSIGKHTKLYRQVAAQQLAWLYRISHWDAYAVILEMDGDNTPLVWYD